MGATRAAVYLRISLDPGGDGLAVGRQQDDCLRLAAYRGWEVVETYSDTVSASDRRKTRPAYDRMVQDFAAGRFDALICYDLDRLTRQPRQLEDWIDAAEEKGLLLVTANGEADLGTDGGRTYARIKVAVARGEVERKADRQRAANFQRAKMGAPSLGVRLTGYRPVGTRGERTWEIVPEEAEIVRVIFERFAAGDSLKALARHLDDSGVPTRHGGPWNPSAVASMLQNPRYAGLVVYQGQPTGKVGNWEPIVPVELYEIVTGILADPRRKSGRAGTDRKWLGSGLFLCAVCDTPLVSWSGNPRRYRCPRGHLTRSQGPTDSFVIAVVEARLQDPRLVRAMNRPKDGEAERLAKEIRRLRDRLTVIEADYDAGRIDGRRFATATEKVRAVLRPMEARRAELVAGNGVGLVLAAPDPVAAFRGTSLMIRRTVIDALLTVRLHPGTRGSRTFDPDTVDLTWK